MTTLSTSLINSTADHYQNTVITSNTSTVTSGLLTSKIIINSVNILVSAFGIFGNLIVLILICRCPQLRKHCKYLQAALAAGDAVLCYGQFVTSIMNMLIAQTNLKMQRWKCLMIASPPAFAIMYSMAVTVFIASDRCYAILCPMKYRQLSKVRICQISGGISCLLALACTLATYTDVDMFDYPNGCVGSGSRSARFEPLIRYFSLTSSSLVVLIYPFTLMAIRYKLKKLTKSSSSLTGNKQKDKENTAVFMKQVKVTASITCVVAAGLILYVIPNLLVFILPVMGVAIPASWDAPSYVGVGLSLHSSVNCIFYMWKDTKMREAFFQLFHLQAKNLVSPVLPFSVTVNENRISTTDFR